VRGSPILVQDFSGGVNLADGVYQLASNEARDARNVTSAERGNLRKRDGSQVWGTLGQNPLSLFGALAPRVLIASGSTFLYSIDAARAVVQIASGLTAGQRWQWIAAPTVGGQGPLFGTNGVEQRYTDGTLAGTGTWTAAAGILPLGRYVAYAMRRVFMAGMATYAGVADPSSTLAASAIGSPRDWTVDVNQGWVVELDPSDGDAITGVCGSGMNLVVFKNYKIFQVYDTDTGANRRMSDRIGCVAPRSIVETPYGVFFLSEDHGICRTNGQSVERVSGKILPLLRSIPPAMRSSVCAAFLNDHLYVAIATGTANDLLLDLDIKQNAWWIHSLAMSDIVTWDPGAGLGLFGARSGQPNVQQLLVPGLTTDDVPAAGGAGTIFQTYYTGPWETFRQPYRRKRIREVHFDGRGRIAVSVATDFARGATTSLDHTFSAESALFGVNDGSAFGVNDGSVFGGPADVAEARALNLGVARAWSMMFGNDTADPLEIDSYTLMVSNRKD
jgi:hypothetical protein